MIEVNQLTKDYGPHHAVKDISFKVDKGEIIGFLGPNGAGKSTTMKILSGLMPATGGTAKVAGFDVFDDNLEVRRNVGYLPETPPVYTDMKVSDYLDYAARLNDVEKGKVSAAVDSAIQRTGLGEVRNRLIGNLSKGFKQRVGIAQAIVHDPKVLILDEPTSGLDPKQIIEIRDLMKSLAGDHTVILSTHILPEVTATCERIIVINRGKIVAQQNLDEFGALSREGLILKLGVRETKDSGIQSLKTVSGVKEINTEGKNVFLTIEQDSEELRQAIVEKAIKEGLGVTEFTARRPSLEETFLQLITEQA